MQGLSVETDLPGSQLLLILKHHGARIDESELWLT